MSGNLAIAAVSAVIVKYLLQNPLPGDSIRCSRA